MKAIAIAIIAIAVSLASCGGRYEPKQQTDDERRAATAGAQDTARQSEWVDWYILSVTAACKIKRQRPVWLIVNAVMCWADYQH